METLREDLNTENLRIAVLGGFTIKPDKNRQASFELNGVTIWPVRSGWKAAETETREDGVYFVNHRSYETLREALNTELGETHE